MNRVTFICSLLAATLFAGCGYHVAGRNDALPKTIHVIAVPAIENKTSSYRIEQRLTAATIHEFLARTNYKVVSAPESGDAVLHGKVLTVEAVPLLFTSIPATATTPATTRATTMLVTMKCDVTLTESSTQKVLYHNDNFVFRNEYEISTDVKSFRRTGPGSRPHGAGFCKTPGCRGNGKLLMPPLTSHELLSRLKKGKPVPAIVLLGAEPYLRDICRAQLIEQYVPEAARTWAVSRFSAERGDIQAALDQAQTLPMLSPQQVVFLENAEAIEEFAEKKREDAVEQLEAYLADPAPFTVLVLEAAHLDQRMKLSKLLVEKSLVVRVGLGDDLNQRNAAAVALARSLAKEQGVEFEKGAAEDLAECVSADLQRLKTEIEKLATFAGERKTILLEDVASMVISERTTTVWEMADMIASRQGKRALDFLDRLLRSGEEPIFLLGGLLFMYRKLVEASEVKGAVNGWQAARALQMAPEKAELAVRNARKISQPRLLAGVRAFQLADNRLKGGSENPRAVMEFLIAELTAPETK